MHNRISPECSAEQKIERALALAEVLSNAQLKDMVKDALIMGEKVLNVNYMLNINPPDLQIIVDILTLVPITDLRMRYCHLGDEMMNTLTKNTSLTSLDVAGNEIGDMNAKNLARNTTLIRLDVSANNISDVGAVALAQNTTLRELSCNSTKIGDVGAKAFASNSTLTTLFMEDCKIGTKGVKAFIDAAKNNYCLLVIYGDSKDFFLELTPYLEQNKKIGLRETLDHADSVIKQTLSFIDKTPKEVEIEVSTIHIPAVDSAIQRLNATLSIMQEETSETAQKIITQLHEKFTQCVEKQISYYKELGEINDTPVDITAIANAHLAIPSSHPDYQSQRILAFQGLYFGYSKLDDKESIRPSFCMALQALCQDDDTSPLLVTFMNESDQRIFDTALSTAAANGKILRGTQHLDSDLRKKYLELTVDQWEPIGEQEIEVKARLKVAICHMLTPIQNPFNLFQPAATTTSTTSNNDQSPNHKTTSEVFHA